MTFKYNTRQFIKEMQIRPCLWNVNTAEYNDRVTRELAWIEIAQIMYDDWDDLKSNDKTEKVKDLQKKWKGLRDYFTREKNKKHTTKNVTELQLQRNRKRPFLDMLYFLNAKKKTNQAPQNQPPAETNRGTETMKHRNSLVTCYQERPVATATQSAITRQTTTQPTAQETTGTQSSDPDTNFLLSILPDMKSMNPSQNFEFRFQVMTLIKNMKYNQHNPDYYVYCDPVPSTFANQLPKYKTTVPEQEMDPISNESVSSPEDRKVILQDSPNSSPSK